MVHMSIEEARAYKFPKKPKYNNIKVEHNGRKFDSIHEMQTAKELELLKKAKDPAVKIIKIDYQTRFPLIVNDVKVCVYIADFVVTRANGKVDVIDSKSEITAKLPVYRLKKKLMLACHNIDIIEM